MLNKEKYLGVDITTESEKNILEYIIKSIKEKQKFYIVTPNPELIVIADSDRKYQEVLNQARISLPDGAGLIVAGKILGKQALKRITGVDFMLELCTEASKNALSIGLLGAGAGIAERTARCLRQSYPNLNIVHAGEEWEESSKLKVQSSKLQLHTQKLQEQKTKNKKPIDILFVAFGSPKQEKWIAENLDNLPVHAAMGVGGAFDFISGNVSRAPVTIRKIGLEWVYRLIRQPWRLRRQLRLVKFMWLVFKERLRSL